VAGGLCSVCGSRAAAGSTSHNTAAPLLLFLATSVVWALSCRSCQMGGPKRHLPQKSVLDEAQLLAFLDREGLKPVHARTIWRHVLKTGGVGCIADVAGTSVSASYPREIHIHSPPRPG
jgi:hypothetical protein